MRDLLAKTLRLREWERWRESDKEGVVLQIRSLLYLDTRVSKGKEVSGDGRDRNVEGKIKFTL